MIRDLSPHRVFLAGTLLAALFAAYISLVPFSFETLTAGEVRDALALGLKTGITSRTNFVANIVLFVPFGFLAAGAMHRMRSLSGKVALVVAAAAVVSVTIEALQVFVPGRTSSIGDVGAQLVGTAIGYAGWAAIGVEALRWCDRFRTGQTRTASTTLLTLYAAARAAALLLPLDVTVNLAALARKYRAGGVRLVPFAAGTTEDVLQDAAISILLALPIGVLATIGWTRPGTRRSVPLAVLAAGAFVAALEAAQIIILSRVADVTDVVTGTAGAAAGAIAAGRFSRMGEVGRVPTPRPDRLGTAVCAAGALFYVLYNWSPFDFTISASLVRDRLPMLFGIPFYNYYQNSEIQAVSEFVTKALVAIPLGIGARLVVSSGSPSAYPRVRVVAACIAAAGFFAVVEMGQLFLPQRYPDATDVLIAAIGCATGAAFTSMFQRRRDSSHAKEPDHDGVAGSPP